MMSSDNDDEKTTGTRIPMFNGDPAQWKYWKRTMESYMARLGFSELMDEDPGNMILKDKEDPDPQMQRPRRKWIG